eukprot:364509-Chlamydomonas_euryale.AAC.18
MDRGECRSGESELRVPAVCQARPSPPALPQVWRRGWRPAQRDVWQRSGGDPFDCGASEGPLHGGGDVSGGQDVWELPGCDVWGLSWWDVWELPGCDV